jgi:thimet oligopeptidase
MRRKPAGTRDRVLPAAIRVTVIGGTVSLIRTAAAVAAVALAAPAPSGAAEPFTPTAIDWHLDAAAIRSSCAAKIARARKALEAIATANGPRTFRNTVLAIENVTADLGDALVAETFLSQVSPDKNIRKVSLACSNDQSAFGTDLAADPRLYRATVAAQKSRTAATAVDRALTTLYVQQFERSGAALRTAERAEFVRLSKQLTTAQNRYNENYSNDKTTMAITAAEAKGLAPAFLHSLKRTAGGYVVPVNESTSPQFLNNASSEAARKRFYLAFGHIQAGPNVALLEKAIGIRDRLAHLLGFSSWAAYQLAPRVDPNPRHIHRFLDDLDAHVLPQARKQIDELAALKARRTGTRAPLQLWDVGYYLNELRKAKYAFDPEEVRRYYPAPHMVDAVMAIYQHLLGVKFSPIVPADTWYPDVTEYAISDAASGKFIGTFYLDLFPRDGKPGGAYNAPVLTVRRDRNGRFRPPISVMQVSGWPAATGGKPALLRHEDVVVFFHEFGHLMASLLAETPYETLAQFQQDFVEAPSQMLENFMWTPAIMKKVSANADTGAPIPDVLIAKLVKARCVTDRLCNAYAATRQLLYSLVDLDYHMAGPRVDTTATWARVSRETTPFALPVGLHPQAQFGHLMGGYDAGYYTYLWSLVYAQDMFTAFRDGGLENPAVGMRYRRTILAPARALSPDVEVRNFLGRPMSPAAFYNGFKHGP